MKFAVYIREKVEMGYGRERADDWIKKGARATLEAAGDLAAKSIGRVHGAVQHAPDEWRIAQGSASDPKFAVIKRGHYKNETHGSYDGTWNPRLPDDLPKDAIRAIIKKLEPLLK